MRFLKPHLLPVVILVLRPRRLFTIVVIPRCLGEPHNFRSSLLFVAQIIPVSARTCSSLIESDKKSIHASDTKSIQASDHKCEYRVWPSDPDVWGICTLTRRQHQALERSNRSHRNLLVNTTLERTRTCVVASSAPTLVRVPHLFATRARRESVTERARWKSGMLTFWVYPSFSAASLTS